MNRRGFLRGAISVMAVAAILKGVPKEKLYDLKGHLTTYISNHRPSEEQGFVHLDNNGHTTLFSGYKPGDRIRVSNTGKYNGIYIIEPCNTKATKIA